MTESMKERRERITAFINEAGDVTFAQIKERFPEVSEMTLRTDLKTLDEERLIVRTHGGARSVQFVVGTDGLLLNRTMHNVAAKEEIARKAVGLVRPNSTIFLDSGSTIAALAKVLPDERALVFTNSLTCAVELARLEQGRCIVIGGNLNRFSMSLVGSKSIEDINALSFDQLFLGVTAYDADMGFSCGSDEDAAFKRALIARADETFVLMDSSKIGRKTTFSICGLPQVDAIVGDGKLPHDFLKACEDAGVEVI